MRRLDAERSVDQPRGAFFPRVEQGVPKGFDRLRADGVHGGEAHARALVELDVPRCGLEGARPQPADMLAQVVGRDGPRPRRLDDEPLRPGGDRAVSERGMRVALDR